MTSACRYCNPAPADLLLELDAGILLLPIRPHVSPSEGGHLIVTPRKHTPDRRGFVPAEALTVDLLTMIAADALHAVLAADWQNFQENGNWNAEPEMGHAHVHIYGRRRGATEQPFGEALRFPLNRDRDAWKVEGPNPEQRDELRGYVERQRREYPRFDLAIAAAGKAD